MLVACARPQLQVCTDQMSQNPGYQDHNHLPSHLMETTWPDSWL